METRQTNKVMLSGASNSRRLMPGHRVNITEHAQFEVEYLITRVTHEGTNPQALDEGALAKADITSAIPFTNH
ncbi:contractile injection system protein, VgrG/Pvc8 family, partial [Zooshikella harenae]